MSSSFFFSSSSSSSSFFFSSFFFFSSIFLWGRVGWVGAGCQQKHEGGRTVTIQYLYTCIIVFDRYIFYRLRRTLPKKKRRRKEQLRTHKKSKKSK